MLQLLINGTEAQGSVVPIRWCVSKGDLAKIADNVAAGTRLYLAMIIIDPHGREKRRLFPLENMMEYVYFQAPGKNTVVAKVIKVSSRHEYGNVWDEVLSKRNGHYETTIYSRHSYTWNNSFGTIHDGEDNEIVFSAAVDVIVPETAFAKEPPEWEKKYVHLIWRTPALNQCEYRRKRIFAYTVQPIILVLGAALGLIIVPLVYAVLLVVGVLGPAIFGYYPSDPMAFVKFWENDGVDDTFDGADIKRWFPVRATKVNKLVKSSKTVFFSPFARPWLPLLVILVIQMNNTAQGSTMHWSINEVILTGILIWVMFVTALAVIDLVEIVGMRIAQKINKRANVEPERPTADKDKEALKKAIISSYGTASCDFLDLSAKLDALPHKTVRLVYEDFKAKVCKPFAQ